MKRKNITRAVLLSAGLLGGLLGGEAAAQSRSITQRTSTVVTGNINYVTTGASFRVNAGNTGSYTSCDLKQPAYSSSYPGYTRTSGAVSPARITANTVPAGATVRAAYLYWVSSAGESGFNGNQAYVTKSVKFYVDGTAAPASPNVTASDSWSASFNTGYTDSNGYYIYQYGMGAIADVTSIVRSNPNARYRMDDLWVFNGAASTSSYYQTTTCDTNTAYGNWALYIVYDLPGESTKTFSLYDGLTFVGGGSGISSSSATLSGLRIPNATAGSEKIAKTTIHVSDGDSASGSTSSADTFQISTNLDPRFSVYNSINPQNDVFNSSLSYGLAQGGTATGSTDPAVVGGLDFDTFDVSNQVSAGAQSLTTTVDSGSGELLVVHSMALMATNTTADVAISKTGPASRNGSGNITYTLTASNNGPNEAYNVVVSDPLPSGVTYVSNTGGGTYDANTRTVTWNLGTLASGATRTLGVTVSVPGSPTSYQNKATIDSGSYDSNTNNNSSTVTTTVLAPPTVSKAYSPTSIPADGTTSTLTITLRNPNSSAITLSSALNDDIGAGLEIVGVSDTCPGTASFSGTVITYPSGSTLNSGSCTITATVRSSTAGSYPNTIPAGALQTNAGSNASAANATLTVTPVADLVVTKTDGADTVTLGGTTTYTIRVTNNGPATVTGAVLSDTPGTGLNLGTLTCTSAVGNRCTTNPTSFPITLPTLAPREFYAMRVTADVTGRDANGNVVNTARVAAPSGITDTNSSNDAATDTDTVISNPPQLTVSKTAAQSTYTAGNNVTYTVTVTNSSPNTFTTGAIDLRDLLPQNMQLVSVSRSGGAAGTVSNVSPAGTTGEVSWTFTPSASLESGQNVSFAVTGSIPAGFVGGTMTNRVSVGGGGGNTAPDPATCTTTTGQCAVADISVQAAPPPPVATNEIPQYSTCFDFSGINLTDGQSTPTRTFTAPGGVTVNYTVSRVSSSRSGDGFIGGATLVNPTWGSYFGTGTSANSLLTLDGTGAGFNQTLNFNLRAWATLADGSAVPLTILTGTAENDAATAEYVRTTTNGTPFAAAYVNNTGSGQRVLQVDAASTQATMQMQGNNLVVLATSKTATQADPLTITSTLGREWYNADTSQGFCTAFFPDYGDAPASYGTAIHLLEPRFSPILSNTNTSTLSGVSAATLNATSPLRLGPSVSTESQQRGTNGTADTYDEGVSLPVLSRGSGGSYTASVNYTNQSSSAAVVTGWVDFNGNGAFEAGERATVNVPVGSGTVNLVWTSPNVTAAANTNTYARFRIAPLAQPASGTAPQGEVEDYILSVQEGTAALTVQKTPDNGYVNYKVSDTSVATLPRPVTAPQLQYQIVVTNTSGVTANNVAVTDTLPNGLTNVRVLDGSTVVAQAGGPTSSTSLSWTLGSLAAGASKTYTVTAAPPVPTASTSSLGPFNNQAAASADNAVRVSDGASINVVHTDLVKQVRNIGLDKANPKNTSFGTKATGVPGEYLEYCLNYANYGSTAISNYSITDTLQADTIFDSRSPSSSSGVPVPTSSGQTVTFNFGTLPLSAKGQACFYARIK